MVQFYVSDFKTTFDSLHTLGGMSRGYFGAVTGVNMGSVSSSSSITGAGGGVAKIGRQRFKATAHSSRLNAPNMSGLAEFLSLMVRSCRTKTDTTLPPTTIGYKKSESSSGATTARGGRGKRGRGKGEAKGSEEGGEGGEVASSEEERMNLQLLDLPKEDREQVLGKEFLSLLIREQNKLLPAVEIMQHWSFSNKNQSKLFLEMIKEGFKKSKHENVKPYFAVLVEVIKIDDEHRDWRVDLAMMNLLKFINEKFTPKDTAKMCIKLIQAVEESIPDVKGWLSKNKGTWMDLVERYGVEQNASSAFSVSGLKRGLDRLYITIK